MRKGSSNLAENMTVGRKKKKAVNPKGVETLFLTDGDIDEIIYKVHEITVETWDRIDDQYRMILIEVQKGITKLKTLLQVQKQP